MQTLFNIWAIGFVLMITFLALRNEYEDIRPSVLIAAIWPIAIALIPYFGILRLIEIKTGWRTDCRYANKAFNYRKSTNPNVLKGFGITIFWCEFQFWKGRS